MTTGSGLADMADAPQLRGRLLHYVHHMMRGKKFQGHDCHALPSGPAFGRPDGRLLWDIQ
jgi:hypothetical protein